MLNLNLGLYIMDKNMESLDVKLIGVDCRKCNEIETALLNVINKLGLDAEIEKTEDYLRLFHYGAHTQPAVVINKSVAFCGTVPSEEMFEQYLKSNLIGIL